MSQRHLRRAWAESAAGLLGCLILALPTVGQESRVVENPEGPAPSSVQILQAQRDGQIDVTVRGQGEDRVRLEIRNLTSKRLKVVMPPGLVAVAATGQAFQSMGLGTPTNRPGSFGQFQPASSGFRSLPLDSVGQDTGLVVPSNVPVTLTLPSVCLNYGLPTPTPQHSFRLVDVDDYSTDPRARKALRSLATLGTSQTVAQAVVWSVFNGLTYDQLLGQSARKLNSHEVALASRFIQALHQSSGSELVDPSYLLEARLFVRIQGEGGTAKDARRLNEEIDGLQLLGFPVRALNEKDGLDVSASAPALYLNLLLTASQPNQTRGRIVVRVKTGDGQWRVLGNVPVKEDRYIGDLDGSSLALDIERAVSQTFVSARVAGRTADSTTLRIENRLPFSVTGVVLQAGPADRSVPVELRGLGIAPLRSTVAPISAANATIDRVVLNGL